MTRQRRGVFMTIVALLAATVSTSAHHSYSAEYDGTKCMDLKGTLASFQWENPHGYFDMDVKDANGKTVRWHLELLTPNAMKRNGTTRQDFEKGMGKMMDARICVARPSFGANRGAAEYIKLADGLIRVVGQLPEPGISPDKLSFWNK
jgi:hypothetical protein